MIVDFPLKIRDNRISFKTLFLLLHLANSLERIVRVLITGCEEFGRKHELDHQAHVRIALTCLVQNCILVWLTNVEYVIKYSV